jgi:hypothetical protein
MGSRRKVWLGRSGSARRNWLACAVPVSRGRGSSALAPESRLETSQPSNCCWRQMQGSEIRAQQAGEGPSSPQCYWSEILQPQRPLIQPTVVHDDSTWTHRVPPTLRAPVQRAPDFAIPRTIRRRCPFHEGCYRHGANHHAPTASVAPWMWQVPQQAFHCTSRTLSGNSSHQTVVWASAVRYELVHVVD